MWYRHDQLRLTAQVKHRGLIIIILQDLFILCDPPIVMLSKEVSQVLIPEMNFSKVSTALLDCLHVWSV